MLALLVFVSGMTVLACELAASRLLAPYFGTSLFIWANLIGLILLYLTAGYWLGGRLADRHPARDALYHVTAIAAVFVGVIPVLARPILYVSSIGFASYSIGIFWGSLVGVIALFCVPITLLGCVSPWAVRLVVTDVRGAGRAAGSLYALSTLGSIVGAYVPVLVLIPSVGTTRTFVTFSVALLLVSLAGLLEERRAAQRAEQAVQTVRRDPAEGPAASASRRDRALMLAYVAALVLLIALAALPRGVVRAQPYGELLYESESAYNYIQVVRTGTRVDLILNEGHAVHSIYDPNRLLTDGPWDYFLIAPYFAPQTREADVESLLLLGNAAGTVARQYTKVYGPVPIDGVEIDPRITEVGRRFFDMTMPNLSAIAQDGRYFLRTTGTRYRVIGIDAYRQPYIPFHMTTREFFSEVRDHLLPDGVVAINAGRTEDDYRLVNVLAATMKDIYPTVFVINIPTAINSVVVGTNRPSSLAEFRSNAARLENPVLKQVGAVAVANSCAFSPASGAGTVTRAADQADDRCAFADARAQTVFTDDLAPVEQVIDQIILGYISANR